MRAAGNHLHDTGASTTSITEAVPDERDNLSPSAPATTSAESKTWAKPTPSSPAAKGVTSTDSLVAKGIASTDTLADLHIAVVKRCACGRAYELEDWRQLERKGLQMLVNDGACLDLRACAGCSSCIALPMRLTYSPEVSP